MVDEAVLHSSLVCLVITSQSEHSLHPSLAEVQGSHLIQGFVNIQPPDQVSANIRTYALRVAKILRTIKKDDMLFRRPRELRSCAI